MAERHQPYAPQNVADRMFCALCGRMVDEHDSRLSPKGELVIVVACHGSVACVVLPPVERARLSPLFGLSPLVFFADQAAGGNRAASARKAIAPFIASVGPEFPEVWRGLRNPRKDETAVVLRRRRMDFSAPGAETPAATRRSRVLEE